MQILYLVDAGPDYLADQLYVGLCRRLGVGQVVDYPHKNLYHDPQRTPWYLVSQPARKFSREEILDLLRDKFFDLVCLAGFRKECRETCAELYASVPFPPMVLVDGGDGSHLQHDLLREYPIKAYFKRDYVWNMGKAFKDSWSQVVSFRGDRSLFRKTFPLPLSLVVDSLPTFGPLERRIDVSYRGRASHRSRVKGVEIVRGMPGVQFSGGIYASPGDRQYKLKHGYVERIMTKLCDNTVVSTRDQEQKMEPMAYYHEMASSKIALAFRGGGATPSPRYYEIVAMGALLMSDAQQTLIPNNFIDRHHAVFCRPDLSDLRRLVTHYLREDAERKEIVALSQAHLLQYHTCERRAEYFLDICRKTI